METALTVTIVFLLLISVVAPIYMIVRNNWVYRRRIELIDSRWGEYHDFLSYDEMLRKFWVWNFEKLRRQPQKEKI